MNAAGVGLVVLLGTIIGLLANFDFDLQYLAFYVALGVVHGGTAAAIAWVASSAYELLSAARQKR